MRRPLLPCSIALALLASAPLQAQEWASFHGAGGRGTSDAKTIPVKFSKEDYNWDVELPGTGHSSPVVWGDKIFLTTTDRGMEGTRSIVCLSAKDGKVLWKQDETFTPTRKHRFNDFSASTPAVDENHVYVAWTTPKVVLQARDHDGKEVWRKELGEFFANHGSAMSPIVTRGKVLLGNQIEKGESFIVGLDPASGAEKWRLARESNDKGAYSTPVVRETETDFRELVFNSTAHGLTAIDPATGKIRWEHDPGFSQRCVSGPVVSGNTIFTSAGSGGGGKQSAVIRVEGDKVKPAWEAGLKGLPYVPTGVAFNGLLFLLNDGGVMTCRRDSDGEVLWQERVVGAPYASPIVIGDLIYCCSKEGELAVVEATDKLKPVGSYKFPAGIYATPAVAGGKLYVRTFEKLYCIGE